MRIAATLAGFVIAICPAAQADAIQNATDRGVSAPLELSHELRRFPRPPIIVNALPPAKNAASNQAQPAQRTACSGKSGECVERQKTAPRPAS
jgi:hypothetical protein